MHLVGTQCIDRDTQGQGRIDAAGKADQRTLEAALANVVMHSKNQCLVGLGLKRQLVGHLVRTQAAVVEINDAQGFFKLRQAHATFTLRIEGKGGAIENQLILTTDQIGVNRRNTSCSDTFAQHFDALLLLFEMAGRGIKDEQKLGTCRMRHFGSAFFPDVGTDVDTAANTTQRHDTGFGARLEIPLLVENVVVGQAHLAVNRNFPAIFDNGCRVVASTIRRLGMADNKGNTFNPTGQIIQRASASPVEVRAQQQVFRRITAQRQFRRQQYLRAAGFRLGSAFNDTFDVARQVTDGGVELGNGES